MISMEETCLRGYFPRFEEEDGDPYDYPICGDEEPEIRFCMINFQPICLGGNYEPFECLGNPDGCKFNLNEPNNVESLLFVGERR